jgi:hypothetical protein
MASMLGFLLHRAPKQIIDREITIHLAPREDGGLRVWSDDLRGLILSHEDQHKVLNDLPMAIVELLRER